MRFALELDDRVTRNIRGVQIEYLSTLSRKHVEDRQRFLCNLLSISYERRRVHQVEPDADSFSSDFLRQGLRVSRTKGFIQTYLGDLYSFEQGHRGYSMTGGVTKAYRLQGHVRSVLDRVYSSDDPPPVAGQLTALPPGSGLPRSLVAQGFDVPARIMISKAHLDSAEEQLREWISKEGPQTHLDPRQRKGLSLKDALQSLWACKSWTRAVGGLPNLYRLQRHGRLGPREGSIHVISLPRTVRSLVLQRTGLADFDIISCHWAILRSLAQAVGANITWLDYYLNWKDDWHKKWAEKTGRKPEDFKPITASWLTGGMFLPSPYTSMGRILGREAAQKLVKDRQAQSLFEETNDILRRVMQEVPQYVTDGQRKLVINAVGQARDTQGLTLGQISSHVLTGFEQFAIRAACRRVVDLQAIIYDGFIAPPQAVGPLEDAIREESSRRLGISLNLGIKETSFASQISGCRRT